MTASPTFAVALLFYSDVAHAWLPILYDEVVASMKVSELYDYIDENYWQ